MRRAPVAPNAHPSTLDRGRANDAADVGHAPAFRVKPSGRQPRMNHMIQLTAISQSTPLPATGCNAGTRRRGRKVLAAVQRLPKDPRTQSKRLRRKLRRVVPSFAAAGSGTKLPLHDLTRPGTRHSHYWIQVDLVLFRGATSYRDGTITRKASVVKATATHRGPTSLDPVSAMAPMAGPAAAPRLTAAVAYEPPMVGASDAA